MANSKILKKKDSNEVKKQDTLKPFEENILPELKNSGDAKYYRAIVSAALGSIPWVGALITLQAESKQNKINDLQKIWLMEHKDKILNLGRTLREITLRLDEFSKSSEVVEVVRERIQSPEYLTLVRETFYAWDEASTVEKQEKFKKLITNAAAIELSSDDIIRVFIKWIRDYHEYHLQVVAEIYRNPGITRGAIWDNLFGERPQENTAEADLYRYLIRELNLGGVIRQQRDVNAYGEFVKKKQPKRGSRETMTSAFDDEEEYELSELGSQFVHYVMEDVVPQIDDGTRAD